MPGLITVGEKSVPFHGDITLAFKHTYSLNVDRGDIYDIGFHHEEIKGKKVTIAANDPSKIEVVENDYRFLDCFEHWSDHTLVTSVLDLFIGSNNNMVVLNAIIEVFIKNDLMEYQCKGNRTLYRKKPK